MLEGVCDFGLRLAVGDGSAQSDMDELTSDLHKGVENHCLNRSDTFLLARISTMHTLRKYLVYTSENQATPRTARHRRIQSSQRLSRTSCRRLAADHPKRQVDNRPFGAAAPD